MTGSKRLASFLKTHGISRAAAAQALDVSPSTLHYWLHGARPREGYRLAIESFTRGEVAADTWLTPEERRRVERVRPFDATACADNRSG